MSERVVDLCHWHPTSDPTEGVCCMCDSPDGLGCPVMAAPEQEARRQVHSDRQAAKVAALSPGTPDDPWGLAEPAPAPAPQGDSGLPEAVKEEALKAAFNPYSGQTDNATAAAKVAYAAGLAAGEARALAAVTWWMSQDQYDASGGPCHCRLPSGHDGDHECEHSVSPPPAVPGGGGEPEPVPYAEHERILGEEIDNRDAAQDWADRLAYTVAPISVIGEHSSGNNPWANALEILEARAAAGPGGGLDREAAVEVVHDWMHTTACAVRRGFAPGPCSRRERAERLVAAVAAALTGGGEP